MTIDGNPRPPSPKGAGPSSVEGPPGTGSTLPYGGEPSAAPAEDSARKGLRWRGGAAEDGADGSVAPDAAASSSGEWHAAPEAADAPSKPGAAAGAWVGPAGSEQAEREHTPYPSMDEEEGGIVLTLGWIEQVLQLSFGSSVQVRVAGVGKSWKLRLNERQIVDIVSSMAHYVRSAMPNGGVLTVHAMPLEVKPGEATARLGVKAGKYVFLGISHTHSEEGAADASGERPVRARVGLDTCLRLVSDLGGTMNVDRKAAGMTAMNIYLPAVD